MIARSVSMWNEVHVPALWLLEIWFDRLSDSPLTQEFDAGILINEFGRYLPGEMKWFKDFVEAGLCTMDPAIGRWLYQMQGLDIRAAESMPCWKMKNLVTHLIPEEAHLLEQHHAAGTDAKLHRKIGYALYGLVAAPCRMDANNHEFPEESPTERVPRPKKCERCGEWILDVRAHKQA